MIGVHGTFATVQREQERDTLSARERPGTPAIRVAPYTRGHASGLCCRLILINITSNRYEDFNHSKHISILVRLRLWFKLQYRRLHALSLTAGNLAPPPILASKQ